MSGRVHVTGNCSQGAGASGRGGLLVIDGDASSRCGISMKGIAIVVKGSVGHMSAFMGQTGNLVVCGDCGPRPRRFALRGAALCPRQGGEPGGRLRREADDAAPSRQAGPAAGRGRRRPRSRRVPALRLGAPALQLPRRPRRGVLRTGMSIDDGTMRRSATFPPETVHEIQRAADEGVYEIRGYGAKRKAPELRRPAAAGRLGLALSARGLSRALRHQRRPGHAVREDSPSS